MPETRAAVRSLVERDRGLVWHPYAALNGPAPYEVTGASGVRLHLRAEDGTRFEAVDGMSSWWSAIHGYRNPVLDEALRKQIDQFSHVMFGGLTHEPAVRLAEQLVRLAPEPLAHVFFADSGSVSVEVALKLAVQYQASAGRPRRQQFLALQGGYHGDTVGAMSVCDPIDGMHSAFPNLVPAQLFLQRPPKATLIGGQLVTDDVAVDAWVEAMEETILRHSAEIAGIIVEPILQGAGGMYVYAPRCLKALRRAATQQGILLIFDEIATGFGRTGKLFATEWAGIAPDVMCVGKALTGGYLTLAAMLCTAEVATMVEQSAPGVLLHGPTFMANPLACAVASASLGLLNGWELQVSRIGAALATTLAPAASYSFVREVRVLGAVGVIELDGPVDVVAVTRAALERGVWLRPFRNLVYTMPPYVSSSQDITNIAEAIGGAIAQVHG
ncbi:adenosylmethionine--8-amino-7-oxononanoate transaminase [Cryobacterium sp. TMS1-13-1]|uniref:adenosylmethionine--8-amino-7-oxononanoate transaminase n=1 Tax=Cryobacterium sp. TMS1-13-1 TaxID=1259220 RepID=UPI00106C11F2|nr:adenosylmethionine--8-amino-7-oxononanoate transaminase [Cryobacterium sp. TMS1-13-1]TFD21475.1 adenosylmethionine--8-amino-7-oxononanoate transaminase [Cryobacterium sp. TMS1-13-1]